MESAPEALPPDVGPDAPPDTPADEPTPPPAPAPTLAAPASAAVVAEIVCRPEFPWSCEWALETTHCESWWVADAHNPAGPYDGWWQELNAPADVYAQTLEAKRKYEAWQRGDVANPWPTCGKP